MNGRIAAVASFLFAALMQVGASSSSAAPVQYSFSTGSTVFGPSTFSALAGGASGTFIYDSAALFAGLSGASYLYKSFTPESESGFVTSLSDLSGTVAGRLFGDVSGSTQVANDTFTGFGSESNVDAIGFAFDPLFSQGNLFPKNLTGFDINGFRLMNVRMFWIEGIGMTNESGPINGGPLTPDFLSNQDLPGVLPGFAGRLVLDFQSISNPSVTSSVSFNNLYVTPIPEPETYAMLLAGLGLLGFAVRRQRPRKTI